MTGTRRGRADTTSPAWQDERVLPRRLCLAAVTAALGLTACSGGASSSTAAAPAGSPQTPAAGGLTVLVTNDDGVSAPGIDAVVTKLRALPGVSVRVVAPAENQSGTGGRTTSGQLQHQAATTASGYPAESVNGYPADTIRVALDDLKLRPVLVVSGANKGQNVGAIANISGTVGAARAAAQRGIPGIAVSTGIPGDSGEYDFGVAADFAVAEAQKELGAIQASPGASPNVTTVVNLNVPSCDKGKVRGLQEVPAETAPDPRSLDTSDCTSTAPPSTEVASFVDGFAVLTHIPSRA
jgi:5'-nucleotidase